jgi:hypothetical protein
MSKLRVHNLAISLDGYGAGPRQTLENPLGVGGEELHGWYVGTRGFREIHGQTGGTTGPDNDFAKRFLLGAGEHLFAGIDLPALGYACTEHVATPGATHVVITKEG